MKKGKAIIDNQQLWLITLRLGCSSCNFAIDPHALIFHHLLFYLLKPEDFENKVSGIRYLLDNPDIIETLAGDIKKTVSLKQEPWKNYTVLEQVLLR